MSDTPDSDQALLEELPEEAAPQPEAEQPAESGAEQAADAPAEKEKKKKRSGPKKPFFDIYTAMLFFTLVAMAMGCLFLLLEWQRYDFETKPGPSAGANP